jgi:hypothetical protein
LKIINSAKPKFAESPIQNWFKVNQLEIMIRGNDEKSKNELDKERYIKPTLLKMKNSKTETFKLVSCSEYAEHKTKFSQE